MSDFAIKAENLGKLYRTGQFVGYRNLQENLSHALLSPFRRFRDGSTQATKPDNYIWALKDVSFQVRQGEVVGIIGRNGAGKTTLLRILTRITEPTEGGAEIRGRVSALLEVGTGFHPELTGRENVYLNGAILGMKRYEIKRKFDEIVEFSGVEKFIDTPLKRYSSGMQVRLAFSVAAHLEPEILLVDEVLAVGDAQFQKKCLGKMENVSKEGRTVLFVSHNMAAINRLCPRAILLDNGRLVQDGHSVSVTNAYLNGEAGVGGQRTWELEEAPGTDELRLTSIKLLKADGTPASVVEVHEPLTLRIGYHIGQPGLSFRCAALFFTQGVCAFSTIEPSETRQEQIGDYFSEVFIPPNLLAEGEYTVGITIFNSRGIKLQFVRVRDTITFQIFDPMTEPSARGDYAENLAGVMRPLLKWKSLFRE
ncbi:MAG: ABC transporter ATP-binding protein [Dehalococcoidia bacterium]|nr:MAG: ABC transporter ATP-binding protein [Dehalococcoidia bacterium]